MSSAELLCLRFKILSVFCDIFAPTAGAYLSEKKQRQPSVSPQYLIFLKWTTRMFYLFLCDQS